jgi:hypothetical protein
LYGDGRRGKKKDDSDEEFNAGRRSTEGKYISDIKRKLGAVRILS